jgi:hypothetical protein
MTNERTAAKRVHNDPDMHKRYRQYGHLLAPERRRWLDLYYQGLSMGAIVEAAGIPDSGKAKQAMWARIRRTGELLQRIEAEAAAPVAVTASQPGGERDAIPKASGGQG